VKKLTNGLNVSKLLRIVVFATILSLLVVAIPTAPALAADESLKVSPTKGEIGDKITVTGSDYDYNDKVYIYFSSQEADKGDYIDDDLGGIWEEVKTTYADGVGKISTSFKVPSTLTDGDEEEDVRAGEYYVYTTYKKEGKILAVTKFTVTGITLVDPAQGTVGTEVEIEGVGFDKEETIEVFYDGDEIDIESGDDETDRKGKFELTIIIPKSAAGAHTIKVEVKKDEGKAKFTIEPKMAISATSGRIGDRVTVTGTGFGDGVKVTVTFGGDEVATGKTDYKGNFSINFDVPSMRAGKYDVIAEDEDGNSGKVKFTTSTDISVSPVTTQASPGHVGMDVTVSGAGFKADVTITITYASTPVVFTTTSKADGSFSYTFKVPPSEPGEHTITATDGINTLEVTFFMESAPPPIPQPLLPLMGIKAEQPVKFDWGDVTDLSGVTYTLQVARNTGFTDIVLEKEGLIESEYTMTEAEELESTKKDAPYWWRVKAVDGASNESGWSGTRSFHVGYVFAMPDWAKYLLIGLGGLLLFFIGFVIGRKTGYAY